MWWLTASSLESLRWAAIELFVILHKALHEIFEALLYDLRSTFYDESSSIMKSFAKSSVCHFIQV